MKKHGVVHEDISQLQDSFSQHLESEFLYFIILVLLIYVFHTFHIKYEVAQ